MSATVRSTWVSTFVRSGVLAACVAVTGCPTSGPTSNDRFVFAEPVTFDETGSARVTGMIADDFDPHFFAVGPLDPGDRIVVEVETPESDLDAAVAVYDEFRNLFRVNDDRDADAGLIDPHIDEIVRHASNNYVVGIARSAGKPAVFGAFEMRITVERGGSVPVRSRQTVLLDFDGGTVTTAEGTAAVIRPFDAGRIDPVYEGMSLAIKDVIVATFVERFSRFDLNILTTDGGAPPGDGDYSTVLFGGSSDDFPGVSAETYGLAVNGTDPFNRDPRDIAIVFTESFKPELFAGAPSAEGLGLVMGNVAAHEMGHLLGLTHVEFDDLMRFINLAAFLDDLEFHRALLPDEVFLHLPVDSGWQNAEQLLQEVLGEYPGPVDVVAGDFDGDGRMDLATANEQSDNVSVLLNAGALGFTADGSFPTGPRTRAIAVGDLDGDGDLDLVVAHDRYIASSASTGLAVLLNKGDGSFAAAVGVPLDGLTTTDPSSVSLADVDDDGDLDVVAAGATLDDRVVVVRNRGDGTFAGPSAFDTGLDLILGDTHLTPDDHDGDGDVDLVVTGCDFDTGSVVLLINDGSGLFDAPRAVPTRPGACVAASSDLDGDGEVDLVVGRRPSLTSDGGLDVLRNDGALSFTVVGLPGLDQSVADVGAADLDGDGDGDIVVTARDNLRREEAVIVLINDGGLSFSRTSHVVGEALRGLVLADLDGDGDVDVAVTDESSHAVIILTNDGTGLLVEGDRVDIGPT